MDAIGRAAAKRRPGTLVAREGMQITVDAAAAPSTRSPRSRTAD
jgi:hypothetical protein